MPLIYGSNTTTYQSLDPSRVSTKSPFETKGGFSFLSILKGLIIVGEIGASFFLGPAAGIGLGVGAASSLTAIDATEGNFSALNTLINFSGVAIGGAAAFRQGTRFISQAERGIAKSITETEESIARSTISETASQSAKLRNTEKINNLNKRLRDLDKITEELKNAGRLTNKKLFLSRLEKLKLETTQALTGATSRTLAKPKTILEGILSRGQVSKTLTKQELDFIKGVKNQLDDIEKILVGEQKKFFAQIIDPRTRPKDLTKLIKGFRKTLKPEQLAKISGVTKNFKAMLKYGARPLALKEPAWKRFLKFSGTSEYNDKVVQNVQLIDGNDFGRAPVERTYQYLKGKIRNWVKSSKAVKLAKENKIARGTLKAGKQAAKVEYKIEEVWDKELSAVSRPGGVLQRIRVIPGTRVLQFGTPQKSVVLQFDKEQTGAINKEWKGKTTNNYGGKKDVIVAATKKEFIRLIEGGMDYYLDRYARNRGGQRDGIWKRAGAIPISNELSLFLGYIPNNPLRLNLSILSNIVENTYDLSQGKYIREWGKKFARAFERSVINRTARLITREVLPAIGVNRRVSREISRFTTIGVTSLYTTNASGNLKFKKPTGSTLARASALGAIAGTRSGLLRKARATGRTSITKNLGGVRYLNQGIRRIPGAITPNDKFNSRNLLRFKV